MKTTKLLEHLRQAISLGLILNLPFIASAGTDLALSDSLRQALESQGWQAEQAEDGSLIYRQPAPPDQQAPPRSATRPLPREDLQGTLQQRGWQLNWSPDGNLILRPQVQAGQIRKETGPPEVGQPLDRLPDLPGFKYWQIEKQTDGSWRFKPLAQAPVPSDLVRETRDLGRCEGVEVEKIAISIPLGDWGEVKTLAQAWLQQTGLQDLLVGRIRRVLGIYLISLVTETAPHFLKHQIAIRASDGRVMLLE